MNKAAKIQFIKAFLAGEIDKDGNSLLPGQVFIQDKEQMINTLSGKDVSKSEFGSTGYNTIFILPDNGRN